MGKKTDEKDVVLGRSPAYCQAISQLFNGQKVLERHKAMEVLFSRWPNLVKDTVKIRAMLKEHGVDVRKDILENDLRLYGIVHEALEYGKRGRSNFLSEESERYGDKVPTLNCSFKVLSKAIGEIEQSLKGVVSEKSCFALPKAMGKKEGRALKPQKGADKTTNAEDKLEGAKKIIRNQKLKIEELNRTVASLARELSELEKKSSESNIWKQQEVDRLKSESAELIARNREITLLLDANKETFEIALRIQNGLKGVEAFFEDLKTPLVMTEDAGPKDEKDTGESKGDIDRFLSRLPKIMKKNNQNIVHGNGLRESLEKLVPAESELEELLEAINLVSKGSQRPDLITKKFGRKTGYSRRGANFSYISSGKLGFTWTGGKNKKPAAFLEILRII